MLGYELLYRDSDVAHAAIYDQDIASSRVIINSFINIGIENLVGSNRAFINLPRTFIVDRELLPMTPEQVVLEILATVKPDEEVLHGLKQLASQGYMIALDDFIYNDELIPFLDLANLVKIDISEMSENEIRAQIAILKKFNVKLVAEKVETHTQHLLCMNVGFDYFQGFYYCRPDVIKGKRIPVNKMVIFKLIEKLQDSKITMDELELILVQDVTLTYKLLRYINSATFAIRREIESVKQALVIIGMRTMRNWATLIVLSTLNDQKPFELTRTALVRAKMSEIIAEKTGIADKEQMFTVGLFSLLDALMDMPMIELLDTISLISPIKLALLDHEGKMGHLLKQVIAYEQGNWPSLQDDAELYKDAYLAAISWTDEFSQALQP